MCDVTGLSIGDQRRRKERFECFFDLNATKTVLQESDHELWMHQIHYRRKNKPTCNIPKSLRFEGQRSKVNSREERKNTFKLVFVEGQSHACVVVGDDDVDDATQVRLQVLATRVHKSLVLKRDIFYF